MHPLPQAREDSLALRQALGGKRHGAHRGFSPFVACLNGQGATCLTTAWAHYCPARTLLGHSEAGRR
jgi:hypothetical protein